MLALTEYLLPPPTPTPRSQSGLLALSGIQHLCNSVTKPV